MTHRKKEKITSLIMAGLLSCTLISDNMKANDSSNIDNEEIVSTDKSSYAVINIRDYDNLIWVNLLQNVKELTLYVDNADELKDIKYLPNLKKLIIKKNKDSSDNNILTFDNCHFLKYCNKLTALCINDFYIEEGLFESIKSLETLYLATNHDSLATNYYLDYKDMPNLKTLIFNKPYSLLIHMDQGNIIDIIDKDIRVLHPINDGYEDVTKTILEYYQRIISMAQEIPITGTDKERTIVNKIINYIALNYQYDKDIANIEKEKRNILYKEYYQGGYLYGALEDNRIICGNFAALFSAFANYYGIESIVVMSDNHAWNIVNIDGTIYHVDATARKVKASSIADEMDKTINIPLKGSPKIYKKIY